MRKKTYYVTLDDLRTVIDDMAGDGFIDPASAREILRRVDDMAEPQEKGQEAGRMLNGLRQRCMEQAAFVYGEERKRMAKSKSTLMAGLKAEREEARARHYANIERIRKEFAEEEAGLQSRRDDLQDTLSLLERGSEEWDDIREAEKNARVDLMHCRARFHEANEDENRRYSSELNEMKEEGAAQADETEAGLRKLRIAHHELRMAIRDAGEKELRDILSDITRRKEAEDEQS